MRRLRRKGGNNEKVFGCHLLDHLATSCQEIPQVLRSCSEFIEKHGVVDGIYRLSGVSSNTQKLRGEFDSEGTPDLNKDVYLQDIHCVSSLCKAYFRELPNPLLTYQLYDKYAEAVAIQLEDERLVKIKDVLKELPAPHYRTLEFLMRHLVKMASYSSHTNMHARNLAIVWAPNLLRSKDIEASGFNGTAAFMEVRVQSIVVEFILTHVPQLFPGSGTSPLSCSLSLALSENIQCTVSTFFLHYSLISNILYRRKGSLKSRKWKSIFNLGGRLQDPRGRNKNSTKGMGQGASVSVVSGGGGTKGTYSRLGSHCSGGNSTEALQPPSRSPGISSKADRRAGIHISGPFSVTVPLHITSGLAFGVLQGGGAERRNHSGGEGSGDKGEGVRQEGGEGERHIRVAVVGEDETDGVKRRDQEVSEERRDMDDKVEGKEDRGKEEELNGDCRSPGLSHDKPDSVTQPPVDTQTQIQTGCQTETHTLRQTQTPTHRPLSFDQYGRANKSMSLPYISRPFLPARCSSSEEEDNDDEDADYDREDEEDDDDMFCKSLPSSLVFNRLTWSGPQTDMENGLSLPAKPSQQLDSASDDRSIGIGLSQSSEARMPPGHLDIDSPDCCNPTEEVFRHSKAEEENRLEAIDLLEDTRQDPDNQEKDQADTLTNTCTER
uniref:Si:dkeyp-68b7.12 n=1 Tax=Oncorhynchus mykiss TaxID=8022 RepID=A0A8C7RRJ7_ONCMY